MKQAALTRWFGRPQQVAPPSEPQPPSPKPAPSAPTPSRPTEPRASAPSPPAADGLSEYERQRLANIAANNALLARLGLLGTTGTSAPAPPPAKRVRRARDAAAQPTRVPAVERATRSRARRAEAAETPNSAPREEEGAEAEVAGEEAVAYGPSNVVLYAASRAARGGAGASVCLPRSAPELFSACAHLRECRSAGLARAYALDLRDRTEAGSVPLLAVGGEKGVVELYGPAPPAEHADADADADAGAPGTAAVLEENEKARGESPETCPGESGAADALLSFEAHRGWVGGVQLLELSGATGCEMDDDACAHADTAALPAAGCLLSGANDGCLCLWDLQRSAAHSGAPRLMAREARAHGGKVRAREYACRPAHTVRVARSAPRARATALRPHLRSPALSRACSLFFIHRRACLRCMRRARPC